MKIVITLSCLLLFSSLMALTAPGSTEQRVRRRVLPPNPNRACTYTISPRSKSFPANGGTGSVTVTTAQGCAWNSTTGDYIFCSITSGSSGSGNGTVNYSVAPNPRKTSRTAVITFAGKSFRITQAGS